MTEETTVNADTSVLFNYLYSTVLERQLEEDRGCKKLFGEDCRVYAGGKAVSEFQVGCNRRYDIYNDITEFMNSSDGDFYDYIDAKREMHTSPNDESHLESVGKRSPPKMYNMDWRDQLTLFRDCHDDIEESARQILLSELEDVFEQYSNEDLRRQLERELEIGHDCEILVDAVHLSDERSIHYLAAVDSDITNESHQEILRSIAERELGREVQLRIVDPDRDPF